MANGVTERPNAARKKKYDEQLCERNTLMNVNKLFVDGAFEQTETPRPLTVHQLISIQRCHFLSIRRNYLTEYHHTEKCYILKY